MSADASGPPPRLAVLIPCLDEETTVAAVVSDFRAALPSADVYVFDNNSADRSADCARAAGARVVSEPRPGKGSVVQSMFRTVDADVYVMVDADRTYPAETVHALIAPILNGQADMVIGSRLHPQATSEFTTLHLWGNRFYLFLLKTLFSIALTDLLSGYRALSHRVVRGIELTSAGFQIETELTIKAVRCGFRVVDLPVNLQRRPAGSRSKIRVLQDGVAILTEILALYHHDAPLVFRAVSALALVALLALVVLGRPWVVQAAGGVLLTLFVLVVGLAVRRS